jgi:hypothetical protein
MSDGDDKETDDVGKSFKTYMVMVTPMQGGFGISERCDDLVYSTKTYVATHDHIAEVITSACRRLRVPDDKTRAGDPLSSPGCTRSTAPGCASVQVVNAKRKCDEGVKDYTMYVAGIWKRRPGSGSYSGSYGEEIGETAILDTPEAAANWVVDRLRGLHNDLLRWVAKLPSMSEASIFGTEPSKEAVGDRPRVEGLSELPSSPDPAEVRQVDDEIHR